MRGILYSVVLHTLVVLAVALGLPWLAKPPANASRNLEVDIVRLADITQASKGEKPKPETDRKPDAERETARKPVARDRQAEKPPAKPEPLEPKPPAPPRIAAPKPKPVAPPKTETAAPKKAPPRPAPPKAAEPAPKPRADPPKLVEIDPRALQRQPERPKKPAPQKKPAPPKPKPVAKPKKTPAKEPEKRVARRTPQPEKPKAAPEKPPKPEQKAAKPKELPKPEPPKPAKKAVPNIEREIAALPRLRPRAEPRPRKKAQPPKKTVKKQPAKKDPLDSVFKAVGTLKKSVAQSDRDRTAARTPEGVKAAARSLPMTLSEIEAVRRQIQPCWNFPAGAQDAGSLRVRIKIWLNRDGSVRDAKVLDRARLAGNAKLRVAADAGLRAVNNPSCSPLKLPPEKFDRWKVLTIDFDPSKLKSG